MLFSKNGFIWIFSGSIFFLASSAAWALLPTIDSGAIAEGISSNIELVKQSAIVTKATSLAGDINSTIGSAKTSIGKLGLENAQKALEKVKKEKENLEKAKEKYDSYKAELEKKKKALEDAKAMAEEYKDKAQDAVATVQEYKDKAQDAVATVQEYKDKAQDAVATARAYTGTSGSGISSDNSDGGVAYSAPETPAPSSPGTVTVPSVSTAPSTATVISAPAVVPSAPMTTSGNQEDMTAAQEEIARLQSELEKLRANAGQPASAQSDNGETAEDLEEAEAEIERLKAEIEALKNGGQQTPVSAAPENNNGAQPAENSMTTAPAAVQAPAVSGSGTFRKRPVVDPNQSFFERQSLLEDKNEKLYAGAFSRSEVLSFAAAVEDPGDSAGLLNSPTCKNSKTDEFICSEKLALYCGMNINNISGTEGETVVKNCLADLIKYRTDSNAQTAAEGDNLYVEIMQETSAALAAEAMMLKNKSANYDDVLYKIREKMASDSTIRDDTQTISDTNQQVQVLLNDIVKVYSAQLSINALESASKYSSKYVETESSENDADENDDGGGNE